MKNQTKLMPDIAEMQLQKELEVIKIWTDLAVYAAKVKYETLTTVSALAAALLVIATFNEKLIPLTNEVIWIIVSLLVLIPVSIWALLGNLYYIEKVACRELEKETGSKMPKPKLINAILDKIPYILTAILTIFIFLIVKLILS